MVNVTGFTTMRTQDERIEAAAFAPSIQGGHVCEQIVNPVGVWRVLLRIPFFGWGKFAVQARLNLALIIDTVEANDPLQEDVKFRVAGRVLRNTIKRLEDIHNNGFKRLHLARCLVHAVKPRNLD